MGVFHFPSNFVYWEDVKNHDTIKPILLSKIEQMKDKYKHNKVGLYEASTSFKTDIINIISHPDIDKHVVWDPLNNAIKYINSKPDTPKLDEIRESVIFESWYTHYDQGGSFGYHEHNGVSEIVNGQIYKPSFSMIYILKDDNERNTTSFREHTSDYKSVYSQMEQHLIDTFDIEDVKEGSVLIFPSSLYHSVSPVKIPGRITIAINIYSR